MQVIFLRLDATSCVFDDESRERVLIPQIRQNKTAEINYPVYYKAILAMRYAMIKNKSIFARRKGIFGLYRSRTTV